MNRHVNAIAGRLSLRPPQRRSLEILDRITEIAPPRKVADWRRCLPPSAANSRPSRFRARVSVSMFCARNRLNPICVPLEATLDFRRGSVPNRHAMVIGRGSNRLAVGRDCDSGDHRRPIVIAIFTLYDPRRMDLAGAAVTWLIAARQIDATAQEIANTCVNRSTMLITTWPRMLARRRLDFSRRTPVRLASETCGEKSPLRNVSTGRVGLPKRKLAAARVHLAI